MGTNSRSIGLIYDDVFRTNSETLIARESNLGSSNPNKGPTAKSLFYEAGKYNPGKYGQFLFYSLGKYDNSFIDAYYRSENREYNKRISSIESKNPTAGFLVRDSLSTYQTSATTGQTLSGLNANSDGNIIGGVSAPYYWKDFLYCKYYGTIPNNYMITLRRFTAPVLDNLSFPDTVKKDYSGQGLGRPVAQAVTWFGGNTGNSLNTLINFSTGIQWDPGSQEAIKTQEAYSKGLFKSTPGQWFGKAVDNLTGSDDVTRLATGLIDGLITATDPTEFTTRNLRIKGLRDLTKERSGVMGEYIWVPVDVIKDVKKRGVGLPFTWSNLSVVFEYELTSVGEVNTKAALLDILGNLLSIGTNYGNFLSPDTRYNYNYSAIGFPGGDKGLNDFYSDPLVWFLKYGKQIAELISPSGDAPAGSDGGPSATLGSNTSDLRSELNTILKESSGDINKTLEAIKGLASKIGVSAQRLIRTAVTNDFLENYQAPLAILTGAPVGEWHLTIGNPCNPIAMIGNLVCNGVNIEFSDTLGPDDFPTGIKATFSLEHGRDRERGEIESIFNRGDGRLYQSTKNTYANSQSYNAVGDINGNTLSEEYKEQFLNNDGNIFNYVPIDDVIGQGGE